MSLTDWRRERRIRRVLRRLGKQRVAAILQPGDLWLVEKAVSEKDEHVAEALRTCHMRGWVEIIEEGVPQGTIDADGNLPARPEGIAPVYRVTEGGWNVINRTQGWIVATFVVVGATFLATLIGIVLQVMR